MRKLLTSLVVLLLVTCVAVYALWTGKRPASYYLSDLRIQTDAIQGERGDRGNLLGIQPELFAADYQSVQRLHLKLAGYLRRAREQGLLNDKTVVVLPEHIGTWLWAVGEKKEFYEATERKEAEQWLALSNPLQFASGLIGAQGRDRLEDAYLRMKAQEMAEQYQHLFGGLAREFGITLVAGSIVLPNPSLVQGELRPGRGPLYNISVVFGSNGRPLAQPQRQHFLNHATRRYVEPAGDAPFNIVDTPAGRLGVLIGTDSWYPASYAQLREQNVQLLAVPASASGPGRWQRPWRGFRSSMPPAQITLQPGEVTEGQAWQRLIPGDQPLASLAVFMGGRFWNEPNEGQSFVRRDEHTSQVSEGRGARLINLWL
ncbi:carbon-nitrogen hydrolase family protein [Pseudomonas sp. UBA4194]|uniref:carbon-nitrogen hydrolase family protein n=1 Tax=Pseudomonas sp. UBA4194 TaxID=1947317 RepID=UPI0025D19B3E|nr:carbon-nitrogen hydrolase family protein [Pseudomonas sp. UBA4194]